MLWFSLQHRGSLRLQDVVKLRETLKSGSRCELRLCRQPKPCWVIRSFVHIFPSAPVRPSLLLLPYPGISEGIFTQEISIRAKSVFSSSPGSTSLSSEETETATKLRSLKAVHCVVGSIKNNIWPFASLFFVLYIKKGYILMVTVKI